MIFPPLFVVKLDQAVAFDPGAYFLASASLVVRDQAPGIKAFCKQSGLTQ
jgi:hypothetical protein